MSAAPVVASVRPEPALHQGRHGSEDVKLDEGDEMLAPNEGEETVEIQDEEKGDDEDIEPLKLKKDVYSPTITERENHRITHYPYRAWCRECVEGHALGEHRHACRGSGMAFSAWTSFT